MPATNLLTQLLTQFGHEVAGDCQSFDAASGHDGNCANGTIAISTDFGNTSTAHHPNTQLVATEIIGLSLARAPPQI